MHLLRELVLSALLLVGSADAAFYSKKSSVINLDSKNFKKEILQSEHAAVVEFYAPWCGHCQNLKPAFEKVAQSMSGLAKVAAIDCDDDKNKPICGEYGVKGFPTLKIFSPSGKKGKPTVEDYNGERSAKGISNALVERIPNHVTKVTAGKIDEFFSKKNESAKAILFTNKGSTPALWKSLAIDFLGTISFTTIRDKEEAAVKAFGITEFPKVVLLPGGEAEGKVYDGKMDKKALADFFTAIKPIKEEESKAAEESDSTESKATASSAEAKPTPVEKPKPVISSLNTKNDLMSYCLARKSKTCLLTLAETPETADEASSHLGSMMTVASKLQNRGPPFVFQLFQVDLAGSLGEEINRKLDLSKDLPKLVAVNHRGWYRSFTGNTGNADEVVAWLDAIMLGEGKKEKLPVTLFFEIPEGAEMPPTEEGDQQKLEEIIEEIKLEKEEEKKEDIKDEL
ncbi:hypothetical protein EDC01DRAFT_21831 [Geopyxis carbonaria]|nr:hypothetical protein EDC01DRAFT_21831 [Geopyxis carbonaria]